MSSKTAYWVIPRAFLWRYAPVRRTGKWKWRKCTLYVSIVSVW